MSSERSLRIRVNRCSRFFRRITEEKRDMLRAPLFVNPSAKGVGDKHIEANL